jgi:sulfhydrogenase subunit beta (sulfur reductase)
LGDAHVIDRADFDALLGALTARDYTIVGPTVRDGAIVYDEVSSSAELPEGWGDAQGAGRYRLRRRSDRALFGYAVGPHSWKRYQLAPDAMLWRARVAPDGALDDVTPGPADGRRYAFLGARSCELHAMGILDRVLGRDRDPFVVAVQCGEAGGTCFCVSMDTGPVARSGFDLALTEVIDSDRHFFVTEVGSPRGQEVMDDVPHTAADSVARRRARDVHEGTASQMGRELDTTDIKELLYRNYDHPRWTEVAERCLTCGNCTMVCPTCFCTTVEDVTDLGGDHVERHQRWDSCFTIDYSNLHGGAVRNSPRSRYRQWMTHKLATWHDQFGTSGCVGCGRCIAWCPVGIDITEEARAIRDSETNHADAPRADR